jgi:plastocyanin
MLTQYRRVVHGLIAAAVLSGCGGSDDGAGPPDGADATVNVVNNQFSPGTVTIAAGGMVSFLWPNGSFQHNILPVAPSTIPNQPTLRNGPFTHDQTFPVAGTYDYFCSAHGTATSGMRGRVVVQ